MCLENCQNKNIGIVRGRRRRQTGNVGTTDAVAGFEFSSDSNVVVALSADHSLSGLCSDRREEGDGFNNYLGGNSVTTTNIKTTDRPV